MLRLLPAFGLSAFILLLAPISTWAADTIPPTTYLNLSGTIGGGGWYVSTVDVNLRASDLQDSPASTTYQVDSQSPITENYTTTSNAILNASFEDGVYPVVNNWDKVASDPSRLAQSNLPAKYGFRSVRVQPVVGEWMFWTNRNAAVPATAGSTYAASIWIMTSALNASAGHGAWYEVWAMDSSGTNSDVMLAQSDILKNDNDWTLLEEEYTIPSGYTNVYLRLGAQGGSGNAWFDGATLYNGTDAITQFTLVDNGSHTLTYHSEDNAGNIEPNNTYAPLKIDTEDPQDWSDFGFANTGNAHTYTVWVSVRDVTSGIAPSTAQFRWYDESGCDCWSAWINTATVTKVSDGSAAPSGYTGFVKITSPSTDFGNNSINTTPKVQFRINDVASLVATESRVYALFGPWIQLLNGGDLYSYGDIGISGATPAGQQATTGLVMSGGSVSNLDSSNNWLIAPYPPPLGATQALATHIVRYPQMLSAATALPANKMPSASGVYKFSGNYTLDNNSLTAAFQGGIVRAVIIIEGNLTINQNYSLTNSSAVMFIATGNIIFSGNTTDTEGIMMAAGTINTGASGNRLNHKGALIGLGGIVLNRDLGRKGNPNNGSEPAEQINFPASYLANQPFASLLSGADSSFTWLESQ